MKWDYRAIGSDIRHTLEALSYIGVLVGLLFVYGEYRDAKVESREKNALEFIKEFQSEGLAEARLVLLRDWRRFPMGSINGLAGSADVVDQLAVSFTLERGSDEGTDSLTRLIEFLDVVGTCVSNGICDKTIIERHLGDFASDLLCLYREPIKQLQTVHGMVELGEKMSELVPVNNRCGTGS